PNGSYTVRSEERKRSGTIICSSSSTTYTRNVTIDNYVELDYTGAMAAPQNTTATVSAKLTDPNLAGNVLPNRPVVFSIAGGASVQANTNAQGVATASLPIDGPPRTTTVSAAFTTTTHYRGATVQVPFEVTKNPSTTVLAQPAAVVHGQATSFNATVTADSGSDTPTGTVQFKVDGANFGAPVPVVAGSATSPSTASLSTGNHTIGAVY